MTAALIDQLICSHCNSSLVADVRGHGEDLAVTQQRCPCQTPAHAHRIRTEAAQRAENAARYDLRGRRRTRESR